MGKLSTLHALFFLNDIHLIIGDKCLGMLESIPEVFPEARYQRCTVHFYRNVFTVIPRTKMRTVSMMLKAIHAQESKKSAREKANSVAQQLRMGSVNILCCFTIIKDIL